MQNVALALLWQDGDTEILERAQAFSASIAHVYVIDLRAEGESFSSLADPRLHYAPFRQKSALGCGMNRALHLAYEDGLSWLWILDARACIARDELEKWNHKTASKPGFTYVRDAAGPWNPFRQRDCALLVSVAVARSLGGWSPVLPAQPTLSDFEERLIAQGGRVEKGLKIRSIQSRDPRAGLAARIARLFFKPGTKSR